MFKSVPLNGHLWLGKNVVESKIFKIWEMFFLFYNHSLCTDREWNLSWHTNFTRDRYKENPYIHGSNYYVVINFGFHF